MTLPNKLNDINNDIDLWTRTIHKTSSTFWKFYETLPTKFWRYTKPFGRSIEENEIECRLFKKI